MFWRIYVSTNKASPRGYTKVFKCAALGAKRDNVVDIKQAIVPLKPQSFFPVLKQVHGKK